MSPKTGADVFAERSYRSQVDNVQFSDRARVLVPTRPMEIPPPGDGGNGDLLKAARLVNGFLEETPRIAHSPFGKSAALLVRGAVQLAKVDGADNLPDESRKMLLRAVGTAKDFLDNHPRVAGSPFGQTVAKLGGEIASYLHADKGDVGSGLQDKVLQAARQAHGYLEAHPKIAEMPLGQVVDKLLNGVQEMGGGGTIDAEVQQLAKRVGNFVHTHPRLAQSEFGLLVSNLTRGILALDTALPPEIDPPVAVDNHPDTGRAGTNVRPFESARSVMTGGTSGQVDDVFLGAATEKAA